MELVADESYIVWTSATNLVAASLFLRERARDELAGVRPFLRAIGGLLIAQTVLNLGLLGLGWHEWPDARPAMLFLCGVPSVAMAFLFGYVLLRFNFFRLALERAIVYGAVLAAIAMLHQFLFQEASLALPRSGRYALVAIEAALLGIVVVLYRPLRERIAETIRTFTGTRLADRRGRLRDFSMRLSAQVHRPQVEILAWFAKELTATLDVDFVAGWIFWPPGTIHARYGDAGRLTDEHAICLAEHMRTQSLPTCYPPYALGPGRLEAFQRAGISMAVRREHDGVAGLLLVGKHARSRDPSDEEASAILLLVEQLAITLDNSRLIADRLVAERRAGHLEKLSALGLMSSAIAHEIKNPLSAVKTIAAVLQENLGPGSPARGGRRRDPRRDRSPRRDDAAAPRLGPAATDRRRRQRGVRPARPDEHGPASEPAGAAPGDFPGDAHRRRPAGGPRGRGDAARDRLQSRLELA